MYLAQGLGNTRIGKPAQESRRQILASCRPQSFDQQHFSQARQHKIATESLFARLLSHQLHENREPADAADMHHRWQERHQQCSIRCIEGEITPEQADVGWSVGPAVPNLLPRRRRQLGVDMPEDGRLDARYGESGRRGQQHEVPFLEKDGRLPIHGEPAPAFQHRTETRLAELGVAHTPTARSRDPLRKDGARPEKLYDLNKRVALFGRSQKKFGLWIDDRPDIGGYFSGVNSNEVPFMKTVLITGCSSGYGLEAARHFHSKGWKVVATMRNPSEEILPRSDRLRVLPLDVTDPESIAAAVDASGPIDVLVNNAGIGLLGAFEATPMAQARRIFETNTFGVMAMTQAVIPQFRARRSGLVINVTSSVALAPMPLVAVYTASKTAIEGFTASLAHELGAFDIRVKLVQPGYGPNTRFTQNTALRVEDMIPEAYASFAEPIFAEFAKQPTVFTRESDVAEALWLAANDTSDRLRYPAGPDAVALARPG